jgi:hypothetical protein
MGSTASPLGYESKSAMRNGPSIKDRVWDRYSGVCWGCGLTVNQKHGRLEPVEDEPKRDKMREDNLVPMHQDCALLKPPTSTWRAANQWRARTRGSAGARVKTTRFVLREILAHDCDPAYVRELLQTTEEEQQEWWAYCDAQAKRHSESERNSRA